MKRGIVILICLGFLFVLLVGGGLVYFYFGDGGGSVDEVVLPTLVGRYSVVDAFSGEFVETSFFVVSNGSVVGEGVTTGRGLEEFNVSFFPGENVFVFNYGSGYYPFKATLLGGLADAEVFPFGNVSLELVESDVNLLFNASSVGGHFRGVGFCLAWSGGFDFIESFDGFNEIDIPSRFRGRVDGCWYPPLSLDSVAGGGSAVFSLVYSSEVWDGLTPGYDKFDLVLFDSVRSVDDNWIVEDVNGEDVGAKDYWHSVIYLGETWFVEEGEGYY